MWKKVLEVIICLFFFTSETNLFPCPSCKVLKPEIEKTISYYHKSIRESDRNIIFASIELQKGKELFERNKGKITYLPLFVYFPPTESSEVDFEIKMDDTYNIQMETISYAKIAEFIIRKTRVKFEFEKPYDYSPIMLVALFLMMGVYILYKLPNIFIQIREPTFWFGLIMLVVFYSYAGMVYNFNNLPPFIYIGDKGFHWIYPGLRNQFVLEGFIMGAIILGGSLAFVFLGYIIPNLKDNQKRNQWFSYAIILSFLSFILTRFIFGAKLR